MLLREGRLLLCCILLAGCRGCGGCGGEDHLAELVKLDKAVDRDFSASVGKWRNAKQGDVFDIGDGLRTGPGATAELRLFPNGRMKVQSDAIVRFQDRPPGAEGQRISIEAGTAEIESGDLQLQVQTANGIAVLGRGSRLLVKTDADGLRLSLLAGTANIVEDGIARPLTQGEELVLGVGQIEIEPAEHPQVDEAPPELPVDAGSGLEQAEAGGAEQEEEVVRAIGRLDEPPGRFLVAIGSGESVTIHDPRPPSNVRISLSKCPGGGVVELAKGRGRFTHFRVRGQGEAVVRLDKGRYRYRIRCIEKGALKRKPAARGRLTVLHDSGSRRLPSKATSVTVDADGRRYTVRYANKLPRLGFRWRHAPRAAAYVLHLRLEKGGVIKQRGGKPLVNFESGKVPEGTHRFHFEAGGVKSKTSILEIAFDNTARTAYLSSPADGEVSPGQTVTVKGAALKKSQVSVDGKPAPLRAQGRFEVQVTAPTDRDAIAVRVRHASTGVHYYLRRLSTAAAEK